MPAIRTVLGDRDTEGFGPILIHEHTVYHLQGAEADHEAHYNREALIEENVRLLKDAKGAHGLTGAVDASPFDLGRDVEFQAEVSRRSEVAVIAATGLFGVWGFPFYWKGQNIDVLEDFFTREITEGAKGTDIRCGVIKVATDAKSGKITGEEERVLRAAARVQKKLGIAIITHTEPQSWRVTNIGVEQLEVLKEEGADPAHCVIGHVSTTSNLGYLIQLLKQGCSLGFDTIGRNWVLADPVIAAIVSSLIHLGFERQILLSHDQPVGNLTRRPKRPSGSQLTRVDYGHLYRDFLPRLAQAGVNEVSISRIIRDNPRNILAF